MSTYDAWLEAPYLDGNPDGAEDAYRDYLAGHRARSDREFAAGGHDYTNPDEFYQAGDQPLTHETFAAGWIADQQEDAYYRRLEARHPEARI